MIRLLEFLSSNGKWNYYAGSAPLVIARGGFSGLFPSSSYYAYASAMMTSVPDVVLWCDVQLTKDGVGICFPDIKLDNSSDINVVYGKRSSTYVVDGVKMKGWFSIDFTAEELLPKVSCKFSEIISFTPLTQLRTFAVCCSKFSNNFHISYSLWRFHKLAALFFLCITR